MVVHEDHPLQGFYDGLKVYDPRHDPNDRALFVSRTASVHAFHDGQPSDVVSLGEALAMPEPFEVVPLCEQRAGLVAPAKTPTATARSVSYRIVSRLLLASVNDREQWDVRSGAAVHRLWDTESFDPHPDFVASPFRDALMEATLGQDRPYRDPARSIWRILRDDKTVATLSSSGHIATQSGLRAVLPTYRRCGRSLQATLADLLGDVLR